MLERGPVDLAVNGDVVPEEVAVAVDDVRLAAMKQANAPPLLRPSAHVDEVLEVLEGLLVKEHAREVIGDAQKLKVFCRGGVDVLFKGRVRMAGKERVRMNVAGDANHGKASKPVVIGPILVTVNASPPPQPV